MADTATAPLSGVTIRDLLDAGLHFGHQTKRWNPKMKRYIFDKRNGIHIINLAKSLALLGETLKFINDAAAVGKTLLFVGTKKQAQQVILEAAMSCEQPYVTTRWLGGTLTNAETIRRSVKRMRELEALVASEVFASMNKKEAARLRNELAKLTRHLTGIAKMSELPGAVFVVDVNREAIVVAEARKLGIPVIAIVDTNCDPDRIDYPIPGNDDSIRAIKLIANVIAESVKKGMSQYAVVAAELARKREAERAVAEAEAAKRAAEKAKAKEEKAAARPQRKSAPRERTGEKEATAGKKPAGEKRAAKPSNKAAKPPETSEAKPEVAQEPAKETGGAETKEAEKAPAAT